MANTHNTHTQQQEPPPQQVIVATTEKKKKKKKVAANVAAKPNGSEDTLAVVTVESSKSSMLKIATKEKFSSKYDFVKVRVWLESHYYILSRFIVSRILNVTLVKPADSIKISLELKKRLVDQNLLDVTQAVLEEHLFAIMYSYGYTDTTISRYKLMTKFHHKRVPLLILMFGTGCTGKSTLATQLAERFNLPNVLQTDIVYELMANMMSGEEHQRPVWFHKNTNEEEFIQRYRQECELVRRGIQSDIKKCFEEGKAIIIEGAHLDPALYSDLIDRAITAEQPTAATDSVGATTNETAATATAAAEKPEKATDKNCIIIPFFFTMKNDSHSLFTENWLASRCPDELKNLGDSFDDQLRALASNFMTIQRYIKSYGPKFINVGVDLHSLHETLQFLHTTVLERIEDAQTRNLF